MVDQIKIFRANGYFVKKKKKINITAEIRASKKIDALERLYSEIGSRHRAKRDEIFIPKKDGLVEISAEESSFPLFSDVDDEDFKIQVGS